MARSASWFLMAAVLAGSLVPAAEQDGIEPEEARRVDYVERTGVALMLMDVEVTDKDGRPVRGLNRDDFTLTLNGRAREIYSVDDLCRCRDDEGGPIPVHDAGSGPVDPELPPSPEPVAPPPPEPVAPPPPEPKLWVLYLNFGQLAQDGRVHALAEARRWLNETMQPGDRVQLLAWSSGTGLHRLTPVSDDRVLMLRALDEVERDPRFNDPLPGLRKIRQDELNLCFRRCGDDCRRGGDDCCRCESLATEYAQQEYSQGKWSMRALQQALYSLERIPGSKTLLYFYQNDTLKPAHLFPGVRQQHVRDHLRELEQTAADAALSHTSIVAAYAGSDPSTSAINVGANLADYTGGDFSRAAHLMPAVTSVAGRGCRCVYRIAVEPPAAGRDGIHHASVRARGQKKRHAFRLQHLTGLDRWTRDAQAVLASPESVRDVPVAATLVPVGLNRDRWTVAAQVVVRADALLLLPGAGGHEGAWQAGALLSRADGSDPREFLARSRVRVDSAEPPSGHVAHRHLVEGVSPGDWRLGAFVRDRNARVFGGAETTIRLPKPGSGGLSTPIPVRPASTWIATELPVLRSRDSETERTGRIERGPLPLSDEPASRGAPLEVRTWVCAPKNEPRGELQRFLVREEEPLFRFEAVEPPSPGTCDLLVDAVETRFLEVGEYVYRIRYAVAGRSTPLEARALFTLAE